MADNTTELKQTSSYTTLLRAVDSATTPMPLKMLRLFHTGRVIEDGLNVGTRGLLASVIGLPRDLYEFGKERIKGVRSATPEAERNGSSAWIEKKLEHGYTEQQTLLGRERPKLREGTSDGLIHTGVQLVPLAGSFFIPGVGGTQLASFGSKFGKAGEVIGKGLGNLGFQLNAADMLTLGVKGVEKVAGIERPLEATPNLFASTQAVQDAGLIKTNHAPTTDFSRAADAVPRTEQLPAKASKINGPLLAAKLER